MSELIRFTFDFFGHVLPGSMVIFALSLLHSSNSDFKLVLENVSSMNSTGATGFIIAAYIVGFAIYPFGRYLYRTIGFRLWKAKLENKSDLFVSDKFVLVREYSAENFKKIESWFTYCAMSHNLAVASLVMFLVALIRAFSTGTDSASWLIISLAAVLFFFIFLQRAVTFYVWANHDLNAAINCLKLDEKHLD